MKEFDLEAAKKGAPVCTRDGRKARIICFDANCCFPIVALIDFSTGEDPLSYNLDGVCCEAKHHELDLIMADIPTIRHEGWVNIRYNVVGRDMTGCYIYDSEGDAVFHCNDDFHTVKIEWEDDV